VNYLLRKARITRSNYEEKLVRFYEAIVENSTNLNELVSSDFQNNETNLFLTKGNYRLFSYQFEILTNIVESNKIETAKLLYSIVVQGKESNFSVLKEAYFDTSNQKIIKIVNIFFGKEIKK
jgi:site-specific DNA-adenine methylase